MYFALILKDKSFPFVFLDFYVRSAARGYRNKIHISKGEEDETPGRIGTKEIDEPRRKRNEEW